MASHHGITVISRFTHFSRQIYCQDFCSFPANFTMNAKQIPQPFFAFLNVAAIFVRSFQDGLVTERGAGGEGGNEDEGKKSGWLIYWRWDLSARYIGDERGKLEDRVAKCHGYDGYIRVKILADWYTGDERGSLEEEMRWEREARGRGDEDGAALRCPYASESWWDLFTGPLALSSKFPMSLCSHAQY